ncbi:MAG TPA: YozQ family protein [Pseudoneobacillus sp.]|nr:YozQ family protein [Pseudoneobacillus sp.]
MEKNTPNKNNNANLNLAGRDYQVEDYKRDDQLSSGLATTHEQVSDSYMVGETDSLVGDVNGKNIAIVPEGLEE